jgi:ABC-type sugar transport system permease subunit
LIGWGIGTPRDHMFDQIPRFARGSCRPSGPSWGRAVAGGRRAEIGVAATIRPRRGADARYRTTLYLLLAPFLLGVVVLVVLPVALSIGLAFTAYDGLSAPEWRGLANFRELAVDPLFHIALRNSLVFVALTVPLRVLIALGLALLLNRSRRGVGLYRVAVYVPTIVPSVAYALIWLWIFNPRYGPLNQALESLGLPAPAWLIDSTTALPAIALTALFTMGEGFVVVLAGSGRFPRSAIRPRRSTAPAGPPRCGTSPCPCWPPGSCC